MRWFTGILPARSAVGSSFTGRLDHDGLSRFSGKPYRELVGPLGIKVLSLFSAGFFNELNPRDCSCLSTPGEFSQPKPPVLLWLPQSRSMYVSYPFISLYLFLLFLLLLLIYSYHNTNTWHKFCCYEQTGRACLFIRTATKTIHNAIGSIHYCFLSYKKMGTWDFGNKLAWCFIPGEERKCSHFILGKITLLTNVRQQRKMQTN